MFAPGTKVTWTYKKGGGKKDSLRVHQGTVVSSEGDETTVRTDGGKVLVIKTAKLRVEGQRTEVDEMADRLFASMQKRQNNS